MVCRPWPLATAENLKGDGVALGDVAGVVDVQVVAAVVSGQDLRGVVRVADGFVKIDYAIEFAARADPSVDFLADLLVLGTEEMVIERVAKQGVLEGRNRCGDDADSFLVSARNELTIAGDQLLRGDAFGLRDERTGEEHVVDAEGQDDVFHAGLCEHIAVKASDAGLAQYRP